MSYSKRQAIRDCKKLWRKVAEGKARDKYDALFLYPQFYKYKNECPFCEYVKQKGFIGFHPTECVKPNICPLVQQTGHNCLYADFITQPKEFEKIILALKE